MINKNDKMSKIDLNKNKKKQKLLESAFNLFMTKGIKDTSIQEIVDGCKVAKGTFYLYFNDKYDIEDYLITYKSKELFNNALEELEKNYINNFEDQIIFIINYVIDELVKNTNILNFIKKNLSQGIYNDRFNNLIDNDTLGIYELFNKGLKDNNIKLKNPNITLFMIIELVGSTCFSTIIEEKPVPINEYKPFLYDTIRMMLKDKK